MTFNHANRRLHMYLALSLIPWFFIYGFSSIYFSHGRTLDEWFPSDRPNWSLRSETQLQLEVPESDLRPLGRRVLADLGIDGPFYIGLPFHDVATVVLFEPTTVIHGERTEGIHQHPRDQEQSQVEMDASYDE